MAGVEFELNSGEGAFYGPKLEFVLRDAIGRDWQCGTLQVDFVLPERLDASYIADDSSRQRPVMLHRAILGSFERFLGILIEQFAGRFPLWLAPVQAVVASIVTDAALYAEEVAEAFRKRGLLVVTDTRNEKINAKIREHSLQHVPVILVVGRKEMEERTVALRRLGGQAQEVLRWPTALEGLAAEATPPDIIAVWFRAFESCCFRSVVAARLTVETPFRQESTIAKRPYARRRRSRTGRSARQ